MNLLPRALAIGVEMCAATLPDDASPMDTAIALACPEVGCVPLRRSADGHGFEPVPMHSRSDAWAKASHCARDVKQDAERWAQADAVGVCFPHGGPDYVLAPDTRQLTAFAATVAT
ncbi:MAG TPA: hypothetical protein VG735_12330 [Caulobacterales bacterium]|nr:hypothetical protein [Caulobacterales bacterium]